MPLSEHIVIQILAFTGVQFTTTKLPRAPFCHFYVVINQLGLVCSLCSQYKSSYLYVCFSYVMLTGFPFGEGVHTEMPQQINPLKRNVQHLQL